MSDTEYLNKETISTSAAELLAEFALDKELPVNPVEVANLLQIPVYDVVFDDPSISGALVDSEEGPKILVNSAEPINRKRFTIAHEIGHYRLHYMSNNRPFVDRGESLLRTVNAQDDIPDFKREEYQANLFAANLLMPELAVKKEFSLYERVEHLASRFQVSSVAMRLRLQQLGLLGKTHG